MQLPQRRNLRGTRMVLHTDLGDQRRTERDGMELLQNSRPDLTLK